jgi:hypothetical protein
VKKDKENILSTIVLNAQKILTLYETMFLTVLLVKVSKYFLVWLNSAVAIRR